MDSEHHSSQYFTQQLSRALNQELSLSIIQPGVFGISGPTFPFHIYIYTHFIAQRISSTIHDIDNIHIDAEDILIQQHKIIQRIKTLAGQAVRIYARHTVVARIDKKMSLEFQQDHHLQKAVAGKYRYGLFFNGDLVSIAIFSGGRHMDERPLSYRSFELIRFCHKQGIIVVGGISKLIQAFQADFHPGDIMTYADRDWSQDSSLTKIGFLKKSQTSPQQFWFNGQERHTLTPSNEDELKKLYPSGYPKSNSGSLKMVLTL
ncbi:hypothetical protein [Sphingobacterium sp. SYP-B4668]|uniref:hypothetical protein n=1 Tax=Sphingobacterium sp. SYP-B4668 TaxID=2996035 RepID=UPI0022DD66B4|nr:hypothetical protein [Sphingobacterium sp. SYP-B4668]